MRKLPLLSAVLMLSLAIGACQGRGDEQPDFITALSGDPYTGFVKVVVRPPSGRTITRWGEGSAHFVKEPGGRARLVVFGAIDDEQGDAGFTVDGSYDAGGWKATANDIRIEVAPGGAISGGGSQHPQAYRFSGKAAESDFELMVELELLEGSPQGMPKGTTFSFDYDLSRARPDADDDATAGRTASAGEKGKKGKKKCRKIRYEMRPVASIGDGSMSMMRVPVCLK